MKVFFNPCDRVRALRQLRGHFNRNQRGVKGIKMLSRASAARRTPGRSGVVIPGRDEIRSKAGLQRTHGAESFLRYLRVAVVLQFLACSAMLWRRSRNGVQHDLQVLDQVALRIVHRHCFNRRAESVAGPRR